MALLSLSVGMFPEELPVWFIDNENSLIIKAGIDRKSQSHRKMGIWSCLSVNYKESIDLSYNYALYQKKSI